MQSTRTLTIAWLWFICLAAAALLVSAAPAHALSCLPTDMYLKDVINNDDVIIFTGTATDRFEQPGYTVEVIAVSDAHQGYVEGKLFAYHQKNATWGYLCNPGPAAEKGVASVYVGSRDAYGKFIVHQRLDLDSDLAKTLGTNLKQAGVEGSVVLFEKTDRLNQIITTLKDMLAEMRLLLAEHAYWKTTS